MLLIFIPFMSKTLRRAVFRYGEGRGLCLLLLAGGQWRSASRRVCKVSAVNASRLPSSKKVSSTAGRAVEVVGDVGLVFWQAHGAGAGCHEVSPKSRTPLSGGVLVT